MKVIVAGWSKTGTKSMSVALRELGMNVYDAVEHFTYLHDDWLKICSQGGTAEDFQRMYNGVDAVTDAPTYYFWEELLQAFPEAKVVLTMRDNEDEWFRSTKNQWELFSTPFMKMLFTLSPTYRRFIWFGQEQGITCYRLKPIFFLKKLVVNELMLRKAYRMHNAYVMKATPKDKLLVYNVKEGWKPLCKFLGLEVPSKPFPHKNIRGNVTEEWLANNPTFIRMKAEMMASIGTMLLLIFYGSYKVLTGSSMLSEKFHYFTNLVGSTIAKKLKA